MIPGHWQAVARADGETVGYVASAGTAFVAHSLLGHELGRAEAEEEARDLVVERGMASLNQSWDWTDAAGTRRRVYVVQVRPEVAVVRTGGPWVGSPGETFEVELPVGAETFRPA